MMNPSVPEGTFRRGFFKGLGSGALMMGIFNGLYFVAGLLPIPGNPIHFMWATSLATTVLGSLATGLFSGVMASQRAASDASSATRLTHEAARREPARAPEQAVAPAMASAVENSTRWQSQVGGSSRRDRVAEILADRSLDDRGRAAAILSEREQSAALENAR